MFVVTKANVLTVGIDDKTQALRELKIRVLSLQFGAEAIRSFKTEQFDSVISRWNLPDMEDGKFLKGLKNIRPDMPTIAIVDPGNLSQEISARSLGVSAVVTDNISDDHFREIVSQLLNLKETDAIKAIYA